MKMRQWIAIGLCVACLNGCAHLNYTPRIEKMGALTDTEKMEEQADNMKWAAAENVAVFMGQPPEGVSIENDVVKIANTDRYQLLAKVMTNENGEFDQAVTFKKYPEDDGAWRNVYCKPQVPLVWATLLIWGILPFFWPCQAVEGTNSTKSISARKNRIINTLKKATKAANGNVLVITKIGKTSTTHVFVGRTGFVSTWNSTRDMTDGEGYALLDKQASR